MQLLKVAVVVMGVLIVAGLVMIGIKLSEKAEELGNDGMPVTAGEAGTAVPVQAGDLGFPEGSRVQSMEAQGNRLAVVVRSPDQSEHIVIIDLKRGGIPKVVLNHIYKHTQLQTTFGAILLALDHGRPKVMNLKELLQCFIRHRFEVITRRTQFDLEKAEARAHILEGLKIALDNLDAVVKTIRESKSRDDARPRLMDRFDINDLALIG